MTKLKVGCDIVDINEKDVILDNGSCYQIVTKEVARGWSGYAPAISKNLFKKLQKCGAVYTNDTLKKEAVKTYKTNICVYWMFDIEKLKEFVKQEN